MKRSELAGASPQPADDLDGLRVLIVEDNATARSLLERYAGASGMVSSTADCGTRALAMMHDAVARRMPYDVALIDMTMPGMTGSELAQAIRASVALQATRLVMLTSLSSRDQAAATCGEGLAACLDKPVRRAQLHRCLAGVMGKAAADRAPPPAPAPQQPSLEAHVLLVEDNVINLEIADAMLQALGCQSEVADDGRAAVALMCSRPFDVVLMDCQMPVMDGFEATAVMRAREAELNADLVHVGLPPQRTPIVALTANAMEGDREACLAAGMDDYLSKPFTMDQLHAVLARWVKREAHLGGLDSGAIRS
jgi:CheY-like chemotaxis protein